MKTLRIKNWKQFQHFAYRTPPWIKVYRGLLDDIEWHLLPPVSAKALVSLWLIASESSGSLPEIKKLVFRLRMPEAQVQEVLSDLAHWLEPDDIEVISARHQNDAKPVTTISAADKNVQTEKSKRREEKETEREAESTPRSPRGSRLPHDWVMNPEHREFCKTARPELDPDAVAATFVDYWIGVPGAKGCKANWMAAWRNWVRRESASPANFAQAKADVSRTTVPINPEVAATAARERAEEAIPRNGPSLETLEKIAAIRASSRVLQ